MGGIPWVVKIDNLNLDIDIEFLYTVECVFDDDNLKTDWWQ